LKTLLATLFKDSTVEILTLKKSWRDPEKSYQKHAVRSKKNGAFLLHLIRDGTLNIDQ
jgi:hypothetical protein